MRNYPKKIWNWISHPARELRKFRKLSRLRVNDQTELVIEGFPRSANTFAVVAFQQAQDREVAVAHHHHSVDQIVQGVKRGIPVCVLIRDPVDAVKSAILRDPGDVNDRLARYIEFYSKAWAFRDSFVISPFDQVISDFGKIIQKLNKKFRTNYSVFDQNEKNCQKVFKELVELNSRYDTGDYERSSAPDSRRMKVLSNMSIELNHDLLGDAMALYDQYIKLADD